MSCELFIFGVNNWNRCSPFSDIEQLIQHIHDLKLIVENLSPEMAGLIFSESITTEQLKKALKTMSRITINDDQLQAQHDKFVNLWHSMNEAIQHNTEEWKAENLALIQQVTNRANELIKVFENEIERALLQEGATQEQNVQPQGMCNVENSSWGELSAETLKDVDEHMNVIKLSGADVIQIEGADSSNIVQPSAMEQDKQDEHDDHEDDNITVTINQVQAPPMTTPMHTIEPMSSPNDGQQPGPSSGRVNVTPPPTTPHKENLEHLNRMTMTMATDNNFTLKQLFMYNRCINELISIPAMGENPTQQGFRNVREFITHFVEKMSKLRVNPQHYEPFLMGRVISILSPTVVTQWGLQTIRGPAGLSQLRDFLANFEEIMIAGWSADLSAFELPAANEPEIDHSPTGAKPKQKPKDMADKGNDNWSLPSYSGANTQTGAKPKQKPKDMADKSDDNWSLPSRSGANTPTGATYLRTQPRFNRKDVSKALKQASNQPPKGPPEPKDNGPKCLGCGLNHVLFRCPMFLSFTIEARWELVNRRKICPMCLVSRHQLINCHQGMCDHCEQAHNSVLCARSEQLRKQHKK